MTHNGSASTRKQKSHVQQTQTSSTLQQPKEVEQQAYESVYPEAYRKSDVTPDLKRRARRLAVDGRVDHGTRGLIRYALENKDPYLRQLVTRVEAGELRIDRLILIGE